MFGFLRRRPPAPARSSTPSTSGWLDEVAPKRDDEPLDVSEFLGLEKPKPRKRPGLFDVPPDPDSCPMP